MAAISLSKRPIFEKMFSLASRIKQKTPMEVVIGAAFIEAADLIAVPLWDRQLDTEIHESIYETAMKAAKQVFHFTYSDAATPPHLSKDEQETFWVKKESTPWSGLHSFLEGPSRTDCGGASKAIMIKAIADVIGEEKFNIIHSHPEMALNFTVGVSHVPNPLEFFTLPADVRFYSANRSGITLGTRLYFHGIPWYGIKHPIGSGHGHWAFYMDRTESGEPLYWAMGFDDLVTENELLQDLLDRYNAPQSSESKEVQNYFSTREAFLEQTKKWYSSKLIGYEKQMGLCYDKPDTQLSMEEAKKVGLGFFGYAQTDRISSLALKLIKESPKTSLEDPSIPLNLGMKHIALLAQQLLSTPTEKPDYSTTQAQHFIRWADYE
ncbi:MAG: hypothetical protein K9M07_07395 [Simkaniaceae bacterium]|nr:hypothetical protein [Simkaniaceae bacterium]